jgi:hypothetical protein
VGIPISTEGKGASKSIPTKLAKRQKKRVKKIKIEMHEGMGEKRVRGGGEEKMVR